MENMTNLTMITTLGNDIAAFFIGLLIFILLIGLAFYVWRSLAWMGIAKKLGRGTPWFAWIPILNTILIWQMSNTPVVFIITYFALEFIALITALIAVFTQPLALFLLIPIGLAILAIRVYWWWLISEARGYPGWIYLVLVILTFVPYVNLAANLGIYIYYSLLAWYDPQGVQKPRAKRGGRAEKKR